MELTSAESEQSQRWAKSSQALPLRSRIVLGCAAGVNNTQVAGQEQVALPTVGKWRARFVQLRLDGLADNPRPGKPAAVSAAQGQDVIVATLEATSANATHWSRAEMAERTGLSKSTVGRIWKAFEAKSYRAGGLKLPDGPQFVDRVYDIVGLYFKPSEAAVVLCVDEKSQVQALGQSQPPFPMLPGMPGKRIHDYVRNGTTTLSAVSNPGDGSAISNLRRRHRSIEFKKLLIKIDDLVPGDLAASLIWDNYGTHKTPAIRAWISDHPRFHMYFTPTYSSWINQIERFLGYVTADLLQRSKHNSVQQLEDNLRV